MHEQQENEQLAPNKPIDILPEGFLMRQIDTDDYNKGYMELLSQLTTTGTVSLMEFISQLNKMRSMAGMYHIYVIEDIKKSRIVATATYVFLKFKQISKMAAYLNRNYSWILKFSPYFTF